MTSNPIILTSTFHDPEFSLKNLYIKAEPILKTIFKKRIIVLTPFMNDEIVSFLKSESFIVVKCLTNSRVDTYRLAYKTALDHVEDDRSEKIMYIDFDRLIHWVNNYPNELRKVITMSDVDHLHVGRTSRAFNTHPITQKNTEIIINEIGSKLVTPERIIDILSVCCVITKKLALNLLKVKNVTTDGFYCTWPIMLWKWADKSNYIEVDGLEWETPDRFQKKIELNGHDEWLKSFLNSNEWKNRVDLMHQCLHELFTISSIMLLNTNL